MKHVIYINAAKNCQGGWIKFNSVKKNGSEFVITKDFRVVLKKNALPSDEPLNLHITPENNWFFSYDDSATNNSQNHQKSLMAELIPYHHQMIAEDFEYEDSEGKKSKRNPNGGAAMLFEYEDAALQDGKNFKMIALNRAAQNKVWDMSYREKVDVLYYYGETPLIAGKTMTHKQVVIRLLEPAFGIVLKKNEYGKTGKSFIEHFVDHYKAADEGQKLKTAILKALIINDSDGQRLITKSGTALKFGADIIGSSVEEAMAWLNGNPKRKEYLFTVLSKQDKLDVDDIDTAGEDAEKVMSKFEQKIEMSSLYDKARNLKVRSVHLLKTEEKLLEKIEEAEKAWQDVDRLGMRPQIEASTKKLWVDDILRLIEEKEKELAKELV